MHQVHGRIRFEKVAPSALSQMRLTGNQEHAQPVAHHYDFMKKGVNGDLFDLKVLIFGLENQKPSFPTIGQLNSR